MSRQVAMFGAGLFLSFGAPLALYFGLRGSPHLDHAVAAPAGHFQVVTAAALLAAVVAIAVGVAGYRLRNIQVTLLATAFASLAVMFTVHGLATPGFLLPPTQLPGQAAQASILTTAFWLWLSSHPGDHPLVARLSRWQRWLVPGWALFIAAGGALFMWQPEMVVLAPIHLSPLKWVAMGVTLALILLAIRHYWHAYRYSRLPLQAAILHSAAWLAGAQIIITTGERWRLSWWLYHFLLLGAMLLMLQGLVRQYATGASLGAAVRGLFTADPVERIEAGIAPSIRALDHVLNKPGRLTPEERAVIERHPASGHGMGKLLGLMQDELDVIRHHHERYDGTGYPDRLKGEEIPLLGRILAVADVYDAVTSNRSYRTAWSHEQAMALIQEGAGTQFDPACAAAWGRVMSTSPRVERYPAWLQSLEGQPLANTPS